MLIHSCIADGARDLSDMPRYAACPIRPPLQTHLHAVCRGKIPHHRKKSRRAMGILPPTSGFAARPRAATPYSRRPFAFGTRVTIVLELLGLSNTHLKSRARRVCSTEL